MIKAIKDVIIRLTKDTKIEQAEGVKHLALAIKYLSQAIVVLEKLPPKMYQERKI